jgi:hypothetical protein
MQFWFTVDRNTAASLSLAVDRHIASDFECYEAKHLQQWPGLPQCLESVMVPSKMRGECCLWWMLTGRFLCDQIWTSGICVTVMC